MRVIETKVFKYEELSDKAKEKARDWYRSLNTDNYFAEPVIEDAEQVAEMLGIEFARCKGSKEPAVYWRGFWSQGDGASFEGTYRYAKGAAKKVREHCPEDTELHGIADRLQKLQSRIFYQGRFEIRARGYYQHSGTMQVEWHDPCPDEIGDDILQELRYFADWIYGKLEEAYEWENSDEVVAENIIANEYEFDEEGRRA